MKKVLMICLMTLIVLCMSVNAIAAPGGFVSSPSGNAAPVVVSFIPGDEDCTGRLVITPYGDRDELSDALRAMFEKAYNEILDSNSLTDLNADLATLVANKNIDGANLAVSDLFDIHVTGCDFHDDHFDFVITLDADTLNHFVGLLHMNKNGEWELVSDAEVINNNEQLRFSVETLSPFAVVVDTSVDNGDTPQTGDDSMIHVYAIVMALSALALIGIVVKSRKQKII